VSVLALGFQNGPERRASLGRDESNFLSFVGGKKIILKFIIVIQHSIKNDKC